MSEQITITLPRIDETIIAAIENETITTRNTEAQAVSALREKYATLARQNGYIKTGYRSGGDGSNYSFEDLAYMREGGKKVKALLCVDNFSSPQTERNGGDYLGTRLYLTADARWIEIERDGGWSQWQGSTDSWTCGSVIWDGKEDRSDDSYYDTESNGSIDVLSDQQVIDKYKLSQVIDGLAAALKMLSEKLPQRLAKVQQRATLASQLLAALK